MIGFKQKLKASWQASASQLMVGLDPDVSRFPAEFKTSRQAIYDFCKEVVDATAPFVCGFKPQIAYFAAEAAEAQLEQLCAYIQKNHPDKVLMLDAKRGDIGATARQYAREAFERYQADAVTVNPYMGLDSITPYLEYRDKGVVVLCRTSNPGGSEIQFLTVNKGEPLYTYLARKVAQQWDTHEQCALVVGATFPNEIAQVREVVGDMPLLIPGIGAQGGDLVATVKAGRDKAGLGMMINSSRAILYASAKSDWREASARVARETRDAINQVV